MTDRSMAIRRATPADAAAIRDLTRAAYAKWIPVIGREPRPMTADYQNAVVNHLIDLLYADSDLAALIETIPATTIPETGHLLVENLAVAPGHQGNGYGRGLMDRAEKLATCLGLSEIRLYTNKLFAANLRFYTRLGYRIDREEAFKGSLAVHMSKRF